MRNNVSVKPNLQKNGLQNSDVDEWGTLNQTIGQRRKRGQNNNPSIENNQRRNNDNMIDDSAIEDQIYQDILNEAIIQSLLEQDKNDQNRQLDIPNQQAEEKMLKEVMKMSALEYQAQSGQINLAHLKRKIKKNTNELNSDIQTQNEIVSKAQLQELTKLQAPKNLAPVEIGQKKAPSALRVYNKVEIGKINQILNYQHMASTNTIGMQSLNTNDNTIFQINPSQPVFHNDTVDEESILRDVINNQNIQIKKNNVSNYNKNEFEGFMNQNDFEISQSHSPGKLDKQLEKIMKEQGKMDQERDFEDLMSNIEKESYAVNNNGTIEAQSTNNFGMYSPEFKSATNTKYKMNDKHNFNLEFIASSKGGKEESSIRNLNKFDQNILRESSQINCKTTIQNSMRDDPTEMAYDELSLFNQIKNQNHDQRNFQTSNQKTKNLLNQKSEMDDFFGIDEKTDRSPIRIIKNKNPKESKKEKQDQKVLDQYDDIYDLREDFQDPDQYENDLLKNKKTQARSDMKNQNDKKSVLDELDDLF